MPSRCAAAATETRESSSTASRRSSRASFPASVPSQPFGDSHPRRHVEQPSDLSGVQWNPQDVAAVPSSML